MSTTEMGDAFRDEVAKLLIASGYNVETEILISHKRVDITFDQNTFGRQRKYVVEAKNWAEPLSKTTLETIYGGYAALLTSRAADELLIISPHPLRSPAAKAFIRDTPHVSHLSFNDFQESILGFRIYLQTYVSRHDRDGLEDYYVSPSMDNGKDLLQHVDEWMNDDNEGPLAIIAGYGMGKTSLAEHITYKLAKRFLSGEVCRVPILVRLGMISREQSIEGLIGSILAGGNPSVNGYNYPVFAQLNSIGRFLVLLDGFDEMKHMMTYTEFIANFDELNKLVDRAAKIILLGRPTAFLSENERVSVLRGTRPIGRTRVRAIGAPIYQEINLQPFTPAQLSDFVGAYLERCQRTVGQKISAELLARRRAEIKDPRNEELLSRPIHARMMADLAMDPSFDLAQLSRFALYDHFVDLLIGRELAKSGRGKLYKAIDRRAFAADLAWYLWTHYTSAGLGCRIDDLPDYLFEPYVPRGEELASAKRDLLSGSFLDEKRGGIFFFTHKSFQEFLVAEYIWSNIIDYHGDDADFVTALVEHITDEVFDFLMEQGDESFFKSLMSALSECRSGFSLKAVLNLCRSQRMYEAALRRSSALFSSWDAAVLVGGTIRRDPKGIEAELVRIAKIIAEKADRKPMVILAAVNTLVVLGIESGLPATHLVPPIAILLFARAELDLAELSNSSAGRRRGDALRDIIFEVISARRTTDEAALLMRLDMDALISELTVKTSYPTSAECVQHKERSSPELSFDDFFKGLTRSSRGLVKTFYERDAAVAEMISRD